MTPNFVGAIGTNFDIHPWCVLFDIQRIFGRSWLDWQNRLHLFLLYFILCGTQKIRLTQEHLDGSWLHWHHQKNYTTFPLAAIFFVCYTDIDSSWLHPHRQTKVGYFYYEQVTNGGTSQLASLSRSRKVFSPPENLFLSPPLVSW